MFNKKSTLKSNKSIRKKLLWLIIIGIFLLLLIRFLVIPRLGSFLVVEDTLKTADAIVMLRGLMPIRELEVADIYHEGFADIIILANFESHTNKLLDSIHFYLPSGLENSISVFEHLKVPIESIIIAQGEICNTEGEALAISDYLLHNPQIKTIILVSSPPHMRRALMMLRRSFKKADLDVEIIAKPSKYCDFFAKDWYRSREGQTAVLLEYIKIVAWLFGI